MEYPGYVKITSYKNLEDNNIDADFGEILVWVSVQICRGSVVPSYRCSKDFETLLDGYKLEGGMVSYKIFVTMAKPLLMVFYQVYCDGEQNYHCFLGSMIKFIILKVDL